MRPVRRVLWLALAGALTVSIWLAARDSARPDAGLADVAARHPRGAPSPAGAEAAGRELALSAAGEHQASKHNLFAAHDWRPPPGPPPRPPPPEAPPLPFRFLGRVAEVGGPPQVFLALGNRTVMARAGEVVDGAYLVESVNDTEVVFVYQPLGERQVLSFGRAN